MKKTIVTISLSAFMLITALPISASAHGRCRGSATSTNKDYTLCAVENCNSVSSHRHDATTYGGHYVGDGHDYHQICSVKNCRKTGSHSHDGVTCLPHNSNDGHNYHSRGHH